LTRIYIPGGTDIFLFGTLFRPVQHHIHVWGHTHPLVQRIPTWGSFLELKQPGHIADHTSPSGAKVKNVSVPVSYCTPSWGGDRVQEIFTPSFFTPNNLTVPFFLAFSLEMAGDTPMLSIMWLAYKNFQLTVAFYFYSSFTCGTEIAFLYRLRASGDCLVSVYSFCVFLQFDF